MCHERMNMSSCAGARNRLYFLIISCGKINVLSVLPSVSCSGVGNAGVKISGCALLEVKPLRLPVCIPDGTML